METSILLSNRLKIISGGQTGADYAALDWAIAHNVLHGGWCPKGRLAEDGIIPSRYNLTETLSFEYSERTQWNVRDSDGTVVFSISEAIFAGTLLTVKTAKKYEKPHIHICKKLANINTVNRFQLFLLELGIVSLNIAGSRASD